MTVENNKDANYKSLKHPVKDRFPRIVMIIVLAEFCERFSFSGMRAFLALYLRSKLGYTDDEATETYHIFSMLVYIFPIIGGILADNYLGKFRTILYMMFVYAFGNILIAVAAIPTLSLPTGLCTIIGLLLITFGTGGIKPCVTAFGGDQFVLPEQKKYLAVYFSLMYFVLCTGSLIAKTVSPILRSEVHCFGDKDCYSLAFGAPGIIVLVSIVILVSAKSQYVIKEPEGNLVGDFIKCLTLGIKNLLAGKRAASDSHWLDSTQHLYDAKFVRDIKKTLSILMLFTVLPVFWALLDQMGSRWTLQASRMDGRLGLLTVKPDQVQVLAPINILILIPITQKYVYPRLERYNLLKNPLHKLTVGGVLAGVAFIASGLVEIYLKTTYPQLPTAGYAQLRIFNGNPCQLTIYNKNITYYIPPLSHYTKTDIKVDGTRKYFLTFYGDCINEKSETLNLEENNANSFFLDGNNLYRFKDNVAKSKAGFPLVRFLIASNVLTNVSLYNTKSQFIEETFRHGVSKQTEVFASNYVIKSGDCDVMRDVAFNNGGVYTAVVGKDGDKVKAKVLTITEANSVSMAWLLPQFILISTAEVLFAVTGNEFAFSEAPESMKAVLSSIWLATEAAGNVIIVIITRLFANYAMETQSVIYTMMMFCSITVFHFLARGYKYQHNEGDADSDKTHKYVIVERTDCDVK